LHIHLILSKCERIVKVEQNNEVNPALFEVIPAITGKNANVLYELLQSGEGARGDPGAFMKRFKP